MGIQNHHFAHTCFTKKFESTQKNFLSINSIKQTILSFIVWDKANIFIETKWTIVKECTKIMLVIYNLIMTFFFLCKLMPWTVCKFLTEINEETNRKYDYYWLRLSFTQFKVIESNSHVYSYHCYLIKYNFEKKECFQLWKF